MIEKLKNIAKFWAKKRKNFFQCVNLSPCSSTVTKNFIKDNRWGKFLPTLLDFRFFVKICFDFVVTAFWNFQEVSNRNFLLWKQKKLFQLKWGEFFSLYSVFYNFFVTVEEHGEKLTHSKKFLLFFDFDFKKFYKSKVVENQISNRK